MSEHVPERPSQVTIGLINKKLINVIHVDDEPYFPKIMKQYLEMQDQFLVDSALSIKGCREKAEETQT
jgi:hypothetical protein